jgi:hypothetical protein
VKNICEKAEKQVKAKDKSQTKNAVTFLKAAFLHILACETKCAPPGKKGGRCGEKAGG